MNWIESLQEMNHKKLGGTSQFGEADVIGKIFEHIPPTNKYFVDIGAGYYGHGIMSNTLPLAANGWKGLRIDANNDDDPTIIKSYVTPDNILELLQAHNVPFGFDLLSIDIDSFDLDVMEVIVPTYRPRVICTEYNGTLDPELSVKLKYEPGYVWDETNKYGYSFGAAIKFCNKYGYKIILNHINQNLFLVRADLVGEVPPAEVEQVNYHPWNDKAEWEEYV